MISSGLPGNFLQGKTDKFLIDSPPNLVCIC